MKIGPPPDYEGMTVNSFTQPPSMVKFVHPEAKVGEFYASCQDRKRQDDYWVLGPFTSRAKARTAICEEALERADTGILATVEIVDERAYRMNRAGPAMVGEISGLSDEDARICFEWALEQRRRRDL
jgi:hypothetical protein